MQPASLITALVESRVWLAKDPGLSPTHGGTRGHVPEFSGEKELECLHVPAFLVTSKHEMPVVCHSIPFHSVLCQSPHPRPRPRLFLVCGLSSRRSNLSYALSPGKGVG